MLECSYTSYATAPQTMVAAVPAKTEAERVLLFDCCHG